MNQLAQYLKVINDNMISFLLIALISAFILSIIINFFVYIYKNSFSLRALKELNYNPDLYILLPRISDAGFGAIRNELKMINPYYNKYQWHIVLWKWHILLPYKNK
jgi:hypothetical protein